MRGTDLSGSVLDDRYEVFEPIAEGAMGAVYRGERVKLGRAVAIKIMHDALPDELASRGRFEREAKLMARLEHPHCVSVIDFGLHEGKPFLVMDLVRGESLMEALDKAGRFEPTRAVELVRQVLSGLAHAHELGIVHRDIKPANVMITERTGMGEQVRILDFGLAKPALDSTKLTAGIVVGTPNYMAPEQIKGGAIDGRTDLYAVGVMLFELLTGHKPFTADDPLAVVRKHLNTEPPTMASMASGVSFGALEDVVAKALAKQPQHRYEDAAAMAAALEQAIAKRASTAEVMSRAVPQIVRPAQRTQVATLSGWSLPAADASMQAAVVVDPAQGGSDRPPTRPRAEPPVRMNTVPSTRMLPLRGSPVTRLQLGLGGGVLAVLLIAVIAAKSGRSQAVVATTGSATAVRPDAALADPVAPVLARASDLYANGELEPALDLVTKARRQHPESAQLAYLAGRIYFAKLYWGGGVKAFRDAIRLDPAYKTDPELAKVAIRGFITTPDTNPVLEEFLRVDLGSGARSALEETARSHPNAVIRARAKAELSKLQ
jgi:serine/threonine protein kinase